MKYNKFGNTELKVSLICLGTMTWGKQNNQQDAFEQMNYSLDCGINFFDDAWHHVVITFPDEATSTVVNGSLLKQYIQLSKTKEQLLLLQIMIY